MLNRDYTLPIKATGPANCQASDSLYYGTLRWT